jgi:hypothetical protein
MKLARLRRPKVASSLSYVENRPKITVQYYGTLVTLRGGYAWEG